MLWLAAVGIFAVAAAAQNRLVFSKTPIDPQNPANLTDNFNAGDHIYGLLILNKPL